MNLLKKILITVLVLGLIVILFASLGANAKEPELNNATKSEVNIPSEVKIVNDYNNSFLNNYNNFLLENINLKNEVNLINIQEEKLDSIENEIVLAAEETYEEELIEEESFNNEIEEEFFIENNEEPILKEETFILDSNEYSTAAYVWNYLHNIAGYNDYVCAGIIGNMMAETGGGTLYLDWNAGYDFYGLCQWSAYYFPEVYGAGLEYQLQFLLNTIQSEIDYAGFIYESGFTYYSFTQLTNEREAALAFAMAYERCDSAYYWCRADYAEIAYNYFVN